MYIHRMKGDYKKTAGTYSGRCIETRMSLKGERLGSCEEKKKKILRSKCVCIYIYAYNIIL